MCSNGPCIAHTQVAPWPTPSGVLLIHTQIEKTRENEQKVTPSTSYHISGTRERGEEPRAAHRHLSLDSTHIQTREKDRIFRKNDEKNERVLVCERGIAVEDDDNDNICRSKKETLKTIHEITKNKNGRSTLIG